MTTAIERVIPSFGCRNCGQKFGKTFGWLKSHDHLICNCGARNEWSPDEIVEGIGSYTKTVEEIRKSLKRK